MSGRHIFTLRKKVNTGFKQKLFNSTLKQPSLNRTSHFQTIQNFLSKLIVQIKKQFTTIPVYISYLRSTYTQILSLKTLKKELLRLRVKCSDFQLQQYIRVYGCTQGVKTASLINSLQESAVRILKQAIRPRSLSRTKKTRTTGQTSKPTKLLGPRPYDLSTFLDHLFSVFSDSFSIIEFFYIQRGNQIDMNQFLETCEFLRISGIFPLQKVFSQLASGNCQIPKQKFKKALERVENQEENVFTEDVLRSELKLKFSNVFEAFQYFSDKTKKIPLNVLANKMRIIGIKADLYTLKMILPHPKLVFSQFKQFWCGFVSFCAVKSCEQSQREDSPYCSQHSKALCLRAFDFLNRLQMHLPQNRPDDQLLALIKDFQENPSAQAIKLKIEKSAPGQLYTKKDIVSIQEYLRQPVAQQQTRSPSMEEEWNRTELRGTLKRFCFSNSPLRRIIRLKS